jgi:hypothetical protein
VQSAPAAIDSIIKAESGVSKSCKSPWHKPAQATHSPFSPSRPSETEQATQHLGIGKEFFQSKIFYKISIFDVEKLNLTSFNYRSTYLLEQYL